MSLQIRELAELVGGETDCGSLGASKIKETGELGIVVTTEAPEVWLKRMSLAMVVW